MQNNSVSFNFGNHYENWLTWTILTDHSFAEQIFEVLDINYINLDHLKEIVNTAKKYYEEYKCFPSVKLLYSILNKDIQNDLVKNQCLTYMKKMYKEPVNGDIDYIKKTSLDFCKKRGLMEAIEKVLDLAEQSNYDQIASVIQKSLELGSDRNVGHVYSDQLDYRMVADVREPVSTGWENVDRVTNGGLGRGELGTIVGPTSVGKSFALVNLGKNALKKGYSVVHYSLELSEKHLGKRYDASFTGIPINELFDNREKVKEIIDAIKPKLIIKGFPTKSASALTIKNHISRLRTRNFIPDLVIIDYADIMKSTKNYRDKRFEHESVYEDLRSLAMELNVPFWSASQANRASLDEEIVSLNRIAESYAKATVADIIITMSKSNFYIAKNRSGPSDIVFPINNDTRIANIEVLDQMKPEMVEKMKDMSDTDEQLYRRKVEEFLKDSSEN